MRKLHNEAPGGSQQLALHEVGLQRGQSSTAIGQRCIRGAKLLDSRGEGAAHFVERRRNERHLANARPRQWRRKISARQRRRGTSKLSHGARYRCSQHSTQADGQQQRAQRRQPADASQFGKHRQFSVQHARKHYRSRPRQRRRNGDRSLTSHGHFTWRRTDRRPRETLRQCSRGSGIECAGVGTDAIGEQYDARARKPGQFSNQALVECRCDPGGTNPLIATTDRRQRDIIDTRTGTAHNDGHLSRACAGDERTVNSRPGPPLSTRSNEHRLPTERRPRRIEHSPSRGPVTTRQHCIETRRVCEFLRVHHHGVAVRRQSISENARREHEVVARAILESRDQSVIEHECCRHQPSDECDHDRGEYSALECE